MSSIVFDRIGSLVQPLRTLLGLARGAADSRRPLATQASFERPARLDRILILLASPVGAGEPVRLMSQEMSLHGATFHSRGEVAPGTDLHVQMLLEPGFSLQVQARVVEAERVDGQCRGCLEFRGGPFEWSAIASYLSKRSVPSQ